LTTIRKYLDGENLTPLQGRWLQKSADWAIEKGGEFTDQNELDATLKRAKIDVPQTLPPQPENIRYPGDESFDFGENAPEDHPELREFPAYPGTGTHPPFGKFSDEYIGTGEGNQMIAHGHYVAGSKGVADFYRR